MRHLRTAWNLWRLVRRLERERDEIRGANIELKAEPDWHLEQRVRAARARGLDDPPRQYGWEVLYFPCAGQTAQVGRGDTCGQAIARALRASSPPLPMGVP